MQAILLSAGPLPRFVVGILVVDIFRSCLYNYRRFWRRERKAEQMVKRTFQPHRRRRKRKHGYRARKKTFGGRKVLANRRRKGRRRIAP